MYAHIPTLTYMYTHTHKWAYICTCTHIYIHICTYVDMHVYVWKRGYLRGKSKAGGDHSDGKKNRRYYCVLATRCITSYLAWFPLLGSVALVLGRHGDQTPHRSVYGRQLCSFWHMVSEISVHHGGKAWCCSCRNVWHLLHTWRPDQGTHSMRQEEVRDNVPTKALSTVIHFLQLSPTFQRCHDFWK